jgi:hypothetical protein
MFFSTQPFGCHQNITVPQNYVQKFTHHTPHSLSYHTLKEEVTNGLIFYTKTTLTGLCIPLLFKLSMVANLLWANNHRKSWTLGGTLMFHIAGMYMGVTPLKLMIA